MLYKNEGEISAAGQFGSLWLLYYYNYLKQTKPPSLWQKYKSAGELQVKCAGWIEGWSFCLESDCVRVRDGVLRRGHPVSLSALTLITMPAFGYTGLCNKYQEGHPYVKYASLSEIMFQDKHFHHRPLKYQVYRRQHIKKFTGKISVVRSHSLKKVPQHQKQNSIYENILIKKYLNKNYAKQHMPYQVISFMWSF